MSVTMALLLNVSHSLSWSSLGRQVGGDDGWLFCQLPGRGVSSSRATVAASEALLVLSDRQWGPCSFCWISPMGWLGIFPWCFVSGCVISEPISLVLLGGL